MKCSGIGIKVLSLRHKRHIMERHFTTIVILIITLCGRAETLDVRTWHLTKQTGLTSDQVTTLAEDHNGYIWAGTDNGLNRIDGHEIYTWDDPTHPLYKLPVEDLEADKVENCLWVFGSKGLKGCINLVNNRLIPYTSDKADTLLTFHHKGKMYMWQYGPMKRCTRTRLNKGKLVTESFPYEVVSVRTDGEGNDWLLTRQGLYLNGFEQKLPASDSITHIATFQNICLALTLHEIIIYNHSRRVARRMAFPDGFRNMSRCTDIATWGDRLLVFTPEKCVVCHILDGTFSAPSDMQLKNGRVLSENGKEVHAYDGNGKIVRFGEDGSVRSLQLMPIETARLQNGKKPQKVRLDAETEVFGTYGGGLCVFDLTSGNRTHYRKEDVPAIIPENRINTLLADHTGCLWVATDQSGLTCLHLFPDAGTADGQSVPNAPKTFVTIATVDGERRLVDADEMALSYTHNNVTWHFSCMTSDRIEDISYQYYLAGYDSTWQGPTPHHTAGYKELPPGRYSFHVKASTDGLHWGEEGVHTIIIGEPWWSQWPAYLAVLAVFVAMGLFLYLIVHRFIHPERVAEDIPQEEDASSDVRQQPFAPEETDTDIRPSAPEPVALTAKDERFRQLLEKLMEEHIEDPDFTVETFAAYAALKRTQFYSKVKRITGMSPIELLRKAHLEHAARLLMETDLNIDEVRERCGFSNSTSFYSYFKQQYGMTPRQYRQQK